MLLYWHNLLLVSPMFRRSLTPSYQRLTPSFAVLRSRQTANDVRLVFPGNDGDPDLELWTNKLILSTASPYYKTLLSSDFAEGVPSASKRRKIEREPVAKDFDDSDDERDAVERKKPIHATTDQADGPSFHEVVVTQSAYTTYSAVLDWIMMGHINLTGSHNLLITGPLPSCSPKSCYRLAHLLEIPELVRYSLQTICDQMTVENVASLLFSDFSVAYDHVRMAAIRFVAARWKEVKVTAGMKAAQALAQGERVDDFGPISMQLLMAVE